MYMKDETIILIILSMLSILSIIFIILYNTIWKDDENRQKDLKNTYTGSIGFLTMLFFTIITVLYMENTECKQDVKKLLEKYVKKNDPMRQNFKRYAAPM